MHADIKMFTHLHKSKQNKRQRNIEKQRENQCIQPPTKKKKNKNKKKKKETILNDF